jgi:hypothetical protein
MPNPWKNKVIAFNRRRAEVDGKAADVDVLVQAMLKLPPGQMKKLFTTEVLAVLKKYGYTEE